MQQLLNIQTIPLKIKFDIIDAKTEIDSTMPSHQIVRERNGLRIKSENAKVIIDTFNARASVGTNVFRETKLNAQKSISKAYEAVARYAQEGRMMLNIQNGRNAISDIAKMRMNDMKEFGLGFSPSEPIEIKWEPARLDINFKADVLNFNWQINPVEYSYTAGDINFYIEQYNHIKVEYMGSPVYVPPSADPNYKPINEIA